MNTTMHFLTQTSHLRPELKAVADEFAALAVYIEAKLPSNAETSTSLRKLLEAKDSAVRSAVLKLDEPDRN